jgi:hypothetical protein
MSRITPATGESVEIGPRRKLSPKQRLEVLLSSAGRCYRCRAKIIDGFEVEHPIPHALGGSDAIADLRPICIPCHEGKTRTEDIPRIAKAKRQSKLRLDVERTVSPAWGRGRGFSPPVRIPARKRKT